MFLVTDPRGEVIASLGGRPGLPASIDVVRDALPKFPGAGGGLLRCRTAGSMKWW